MRDPRRAVPSSRWVLGVIAMANGLQLRDSRHDA
jgi:hypothetical protein